MIKHPETGEIWEHEHGPQGGDENNIVKKKVLTMAGL
jgi:glucose/arabinose dehydrogenase